MSGTKRPIPTGTADALNRGIRVSEHVAANAVTAPPPVEASSPRLAPPDFASARDQFDGLAKFGADPRRADYRGPIRDRMLVDARRALLASAGAPARLGHLTSVPIREWPPQVRSKLAERRTIEFTAVEHRRMQQRRISAESAEAFARVGIRRLDAMTAWVGAGVEPDDAAGHVNAGCPGPGDWRKSEIGSRPERVALRHLANLERVDGPLVDGESSVATRHWTGSPTTVAVKVEASGLEDHAVFRVDGVVPGDADDLRDRVRAGIVNAGFQWPHRHRIEVDMSRRDASRSHAALAVAILEASGQVARRASPHIEVWGELSRSGRITDAESA